MANTQFEYTFTSDGSSPAATKQFGAKYGQNPYYTLELIGSLGGGVLTVEVSADGIKYSPSGTYAAVGAFPVIHTSNFVRFTLAGSTNPTLLVIVH